MYEIIQFKTEDEFFLKHGFEFTLVEKFRSEKKKEVTAYLALDNMTRTVSVATSVMSDAIPGMKEMNK